MAEIKAGDTNSSECADIDVRLMDDYQTYVQSVAAVADGKETIQNKTPAHACIIISSLFAKAEKTVDIVCGVLDDIAYGDPEVIDGAISFVKRGGRLRIVLEQEVPYARSKFLSGLCASGIMSDIELKVSAAEMITLYKFHFLLADGRHYRFQADRASFAATARFGASDAQSMERVFEIIFGAAKDYKPA